MIFRTRFVDLDLAQGFALFYRNRCGGCNVSAWGISGSFLLLIFGYYETVMTAISHFNISILFIFELGVLVGLVLGARVLMYVLEKYGSIIYAAIFGLVLGSVVQVIPFVKQSLMGFFVSAVCVFADCGGNSYLYKVASEKNEEA